jgi:hypothetical protein
MYLMVLELQLFFTNIPFLFYLTYLLFVVCDVGRLGTIIMSHGLLPEVLLTMSALYH